MTKYPLLAVCFVCILIIGYIGWDLTKDSLKSTSFNASTQNQEELPDMQILATTSSPQKMNPPTIDESNAAEPGTVTVTEDLSLTKPDTTVLIDNSKKSDTVPSKTTAKKPELNNPA